ncbi:MAG: hypothetical protein AAGF67_02715 [Verrucomicrobiota bacterium]
MKSPQQLSPLSNRYSYLFSVFALLSILCTSCTTPTQDREADQGSAVRVSSSRENEVFSFFGYRNGKGRPTTLSFTNTDPETGAAKQGGLKSFVLGGIAVPGVLEIKGLRLSNHRIVGGALVMDAKVDATYIGIPPQCGKSTLTVKAGGSGLSVKFKPVYCNWVAIGNVVSYMKLKDLKFRSDRITGSYNIGVNGTANGTGGGTFIMRSR